MKTNRYAYFLAAMGHCLFFLSSFSTVRGQNHSSSSGFSEEVVEKIHQNLLTLDAHNDAPMVLLEHPELSLGIANTLNQVDFIRMKKGGLDGAWFAAYVPQGECNTEGYRKARERVLSMYRMMKNQIEAHPNLAQFVTNPAACRQAKKMGKRAVFLGIENGYPLGKDIRFVAFYRNMGFTYITLCHNKNNDLCDSSGDTARWNGLSPFGKEVVKEMNRQGMVVDVSHASEKTVSDVLACSKAPVIASHSCAAAIHPHARNLQDEQIQSIAKAGGFIGVCFYKHHLRGEQATLQDLITHLDHLIRIAGIDHVGFGSDFDGGGGVIGCTAVDQMKEITRELLKKGYSEENLRKLWGENLLRVLDTVQQMAIINNPS